MVGEAARNSNVVSDQGVGRRQVQENETTEIREVSRQETTGLGTRLPRRLHPLMRQVKFGSQPVAGPSRARLIQTT